MQEGLKNVIFCWSAMFPAQVELYEHRKGGKYWEHLLCFKCGEAFLYYIIEFGINSSWKCQSFWIINFSFTFDQQISSITCIIINSVICSCFYLWNFSYFQRNVLAPLFKYFIFPLIISNSSSTGFFLPLKHFSSKQYFSEKKFLNSKFLLFRSQIFLGFMEIIRTLHKYLSVLLLLSTW